MPHTSMTHSLTFQNFYLILKGVMIKVHFILNMVGFIKTLVIHTHTDTHTHMKRGSEKETERHREAQNRKLLAALRPGPSCDLRTACGISLVVQWLRLHTPCAGSWVLFLVRGLRFCKLHDAAPPPRPKKGALFVRSLRGLLKTKEFHNISGLSGGEGNQLLPHLTRSPTGSVANGRNVRPTRRQISAERCPQGS